MTANDDQMRQTGKALRAMRVAAGLTQPQTAAEFGISKQAVSDWEAGRARPDVFKLRKLDRLYMAGGGVLELFGLGDEQVAISRLGDRQDELRALVEVLSAQVAELAERVSDLADEVVRIAQLEIRVRPRRDGNGGR